MVELSVASRHSLRRLGSAPIASCYSANIVAPKLVLYSDQRAPLTDHVDARLLELLPHGPRAVGYVPSSPDRARDWFAPCEVTTPASASPWNFWA